MYKGSQAVTLQKSTEIPQFNTEIVQSYIQVISTQYNKQLLQYDLSIYHIYTVIT